MNIIIISILAGVFGTGIGGIITALFNLKSNRTIGCFLSFAGGIMTSIVFFELLPEAITHSNLFVTISGTTFGIAVLLLANSWLDKISHQDKTTITLHENYEEFYHESSMVSNKNNLFQAGIVMFVVMSLHGLPEGLIIGAAGSYDTTLGSTIAIMIGLHNIPEGMSVAAPLICGGMSKTKAIFLATLSGCPMIIGAFIGSLINVSALALALAFSAAGGAMLYAVFGELLPQTIYISKDRLPTIIFLGSILLGLVITNLCH